MENNQQMLAEKLGVFQVYNRMENNQILLLEKLGAFGILKEAIKMPYKYPKFILLTFLASLPLIAAMVLHEIILQTSMIETKALLNPPPVTGYYDDFAYYAYPDYYFDSFNVGFDTTVMLFQNMSPRLLQLGFLYLVPLHLLGLLITIITVTAASTIYAGRPMRVGEMLSVPMKTSLTGPLITSIYVLFLNSFILIGLVWAVTNSVFPSMGNFFMIVYGVGSVMLTLKWIEWSAVLNMSLVFSVLDERHGLDALGASGYFSRGSRKSGLQLMLVFFIWRILLRLSCLYVGGQEKWVGLVATALLSCAGNVMKWVVCTVYFYDCKSRTMEKKIDAEESLKDKDNKTGPTECTDV